MKKLALALVALSLSLPAAAQERPKLGLGIGFTPFLHSILTNQTTIELYAPMTVAPNIRIEPSLGLYTNDEPAGGTDRRDLTLGVGVFVLKRLSPPLDMYMGGRLKLNFAKVDFGPADDSGTDIVLAAALGGEAYFVPRLSIGLEAQLGYYQNGDVSGDDSGLFTNGVAFLRLYF